jgi:formate dehydrogenase alpha subunit
MGVAPQTLPGWLGLADGSASFARSFGRELPGAPGKDLWGIVDGIEQGTIKALYLLGCDLASFPDNARIKKALAKLELLIVQDIFVGDSLPFAHVVFPGAAAAEKNGSFTSTDNRVQAISKAVNPPGQAKPDGEIIAELYSRLSSTVQSGLSSLLAREISSLSGVDQQDGACNLLSRLPTRTAPHPGFAPLCKSPTAAAPRFQLLVGPIGFHNGTSTTRSETNLGVSPAGYVELQSSDALALGVVEGDQVKVSSASGTLTAPARVSSKLQPGLLFAPCHFRELNANALLVGGCNLVEVKVEKG